MKLTDIQREYRLTAIRNASEVGLVVLLYEALAADLHDAAWRINQVEHRTAKLNHALSILQLLEGNLDFDNHAALAKSLSDFYSILRGKILTAQIAADAALLREQANLVMEVCEAWKAVDNQGPMSAAMPEPASVHSASL